MKLYLVSIATGLLVGVIYGLLNVRSPAPPVIALLGLLGMLIGEQLPPLAKTLWQRESAGHSWLHQIKPHVFGHLPGGQTPSAPGDRAGPGTVSVAANADLRGDNR